MFVWKEVHEKALMTEVLTVEPHQFKHGTKERGAAWTAIAERLNEMNMGFKVNQRSVREKFEKMMKDYEKKKEKKKGPVEFPYNTVVFTDHLKTLKVVSPS